MIGFMSKRRLPPKRHATRRPSSLLGAIWVTVGFMGAYTVSLNAFAGLGMAGSVASVAAGGLTAIGFSLWSRKKQLEAAPSPVLLKAVERVSRDMDGMRDPDQVCHLVATALSKALKPSRLYVWLPSKETPSFYLAAGVGPYPQTQELPEAWIQDFFAYLSDDVLNPVDLPPDGSKFSRWLVSRRLALCLPIVSHGRLIGLLTCGEKKNGKAYTGSDRWLLNLLLRQTAMALSYMGMEHEGRRHKNEVSNLVHMYKDAQQRALTDGLTGVGTRHFFDEQLLSRFSEAARYQMPLSLMMVDVDLFKQFNDRFGHQAGDEVLRQVAQVVRQEARTSDTVARYGGEELAVVMPQTDLEGAIVLAERIRQRIAELAVTDAMGRRLPMVTASLGVAELAANDQEPADLVERTDQALYAAKRNGRNRVCADPMESARFA